MNHPSQFVARARRRFQDADGRPLAASHTRPALPPAQPPFALGTWFARHLAKPVARRLDRHFHTRLATCQACARREQKLNTLSAGFSRFMKSQISNLRRLLPLLSVFICVHLWLPTAAAQTNLIDLPWYIAASTGTNTTFNCSTNPWWQGTFTNYWSFAGAPLAYVIGSPAAGFTNNDVLPWQAWQAQDTNNHWLSTKIDLASNANATAVATLAGSLTDADTNSILGSPHVVAFTTNAVSYSFGATNFLPWTITNYAGLTFTILGGNPTLLLSTNNGTNWFAGSASAIITNLVKIAFTTVNIGGVAAPVPVSLTNLTVFRLSRPDLLGKTYETAGEVISVDDPVQPRQAANKEYVDFKFTAAPWNNQTDDIRMNTTNGLQWTGNLRMAAAQSTNGDDLILAAEGETSVFFHLPAPAGAAGLVAALDGTGTNIVLDIPTNGLPVMPWLEATHTLPPSGWNYLTNSAAVAGTNWEWNVPLNQLWIDQAYFLGVQRPTIPGRLALLKQVLTQTPRTITNSTDTTWGYGAGAACWDSNYIYVSVGSNLWKRAALSTW